MRVRNQTPGVGSASSSGAAGRTGAWSRPVSSTSASKWWSRRSRITVGSSSAMRVPGGRWSKSVTASRLHAAVKKRERGKTGMLISVRFAFDNWVAGSKRRIDSSVSPLNSSRTGPGRPCGKRSTRLPRTAHSPANSTAGVRSSSPSSVRTKISSSRG